MAGEGLPCHILNSAFEIVDVVDDYISFIWTGRYSEHGDFKLVIDASDANIARLPKGTFVTCDVSTGVSSSLKSFDVGIVETVKIVDSETEPTIMTVSGRFLTKLLEDRTIGSAFSMSGLSWSYADGTIGGILKAMVDDCITYSSIKAADAIPNFETYNYTVGTPDEGTGDHDVALKPQSLYAAVHDLADAYGFGFFLSRHNEYPATTFTTRFGVYVGADQSADIQFSKDADSLQNTNELHSIADFKNVAYVIGKDMVLEVNVDNVAHTGYDRRVLVVDATDITGTTTSSSRKLKSRGLIELRKSKVVVGFDGEISPTSPYLAMSAYFLGSIVSLKASDGTTSRVRITEYITISDAEGVRSYPTLTAID